MKIIAFHASRAAAPKRRRRRRRNYRPLLVLAIFLLIVCAIGFAIHQVFSQTDTDENGYPITYVGSLPVHEHFVSEDAIGRPGGTREIEYVVIHETDNFAAGANAVRHDAFIQENAKVEKLSWHYTVDDHEAYHHIPDNEPAYHAGDGMEPNGGNTSGIGVELCVAEDNDYEKTLQNGALLAGYLLWKYDLNMDALKKHQDFSGKICPAHLINEHRWDEFCKMVEENYVYFQQNGEKN